MQFATWDLHLFRDERSTSQVAILAQEIATIPQRIA